MAEASATTRDAFFGGRLMLDQPVDGHRAGTDGVLLAAAAAGQAAGSVVDAGAGVGLAGLGIALACPQIRVTLVEKEAAMAALAAANIAQNGMTVRAQVAAVDLFCRAERRGRLDGAADMVVTNPPFYPAGATRPSPDAIRRAAHVFAQGETLGGWLAACLDVVGPHGTLVLIHLPAALPEILAALAGRAGGVTLKPVHARGGDLARRILVRAIKGSRAPLVVAAPLVLHDGAGFTSEAEALHRGTATLRW